jgi:hypothetical protein
MITGAHSIIYSTDPEADRAFLRHVLKLPNVDGGDGWLIFGLPPTEVAVHPSESNDVHEFYLMTDDVGALIAELDKHPGRIQHGAGRGLGVTHSRDPAGRWQAARLPTSARQARVDERNNSGGHGTCAISGCP